MRVILETVGGRLNQSEIDSLAGEFHAAGDGIVARPAQAEGIVLNACAVTRDGLANPIYPTRLAALEHGVMLGLPAPHPGEPGACQD